MTSPIIGRQCSNCKNADVYPSFVDGVKVCKAYPDKIPLSILLDEHDHRKPYPGDNGIQFEVIDDSKE